MKDNNQSNSPGIDQNTKDFASYVLAQIVPAAHDETGGTTGAAGVPTAFLTRLSTQIPGLDVNQFKNPDQWRSVGIPRVIEYFAQSYRPGLRAAS